MCVFILSLKCSGVVSFRGSGMMASNASGMISGLIARRIESRFARIKTEIVAIRHKTKCAIGAEIIPR